MIITTTIRISDGTGRRHLAVNRSRDGGWCLQWATANAHGGHHFDKPIERGFKTKREATERKRAILAEQGT